MASTTMFWPEIDDWRLTLVLARDFETAEAQVGQQTEDSFLTLLPLVVDERLDARPASFLSEYFLFSSGSFDPRLRDSRHNLCSGLELCRRSTPDKYVALRR